MQPMCSPGPLRLAAAADVGMAIVSKVVCRAAALGLDWAAIEIEALDDDAPDGRLRATVHDARPPYI